MEYLNAAINSLSPKSPSKLQSFLDRIITELNTEPNALVSFSDLIENRSDDFDNLSFSQISQSTCNLQLQSKLFEENDLNGSFVLLLKQLIRLKRIEDAAKLLSLCNTPHGFLKNNTILGKFIDDTTELYNIVIKNCKELNDYNELAPHEFILRNLDHNNARVVGIMLRAMSEPKVAWSLESGDIHFLQSSGPWLQGLFIAFISKLCQVQLYSRAAQLISFSIKYNFAIQSEDYRSNLKMLMMLPLSISPTTEHMKYFHDLEFPDNIDVEGITEAILISLAQDSIHEVANSTNETGNLIELQKHVFWEHESIYFNLLKRNLQKNFFYFSVALEYILEVGNYPELHSRLRVLGQQLGYDYPQFSIYQCEEHTSRILKIFKFFLKLCSMNNDNDCKNICDILSSLVKKLDPTPFAINKHILKKKGGLRLSSYILAIFEFFPKFIESISQQERETILFNFATYQSDNTQLIIDIQQQYLLNYGESDDYDSMYQWLIQSIITKDNMQLFYPLIIHFIKVTSPDSKVDYKFDKDKLTFCLVVQIANLFDYFYVKNDVGVDDEDKCLFFELVCKLNVDIASEINRSSINRLAVLFAKNYSKYIEDDAGVKLGERYKKIIDKIILSDKEYIIKHVYLDTDSKLIELMTDNCDLEEVGKLLTSSLSAKKYSNFECILSIHKQMFTQGSDISHRDCIKAIFDSEYEMSDKVWAFTVLFKTLGSCELLDSIRKDTALLNACFANGHLFYFLKHGYFSFSEINDLVQKEHMASLWHTQQLSAVVIYLIKIAVKVFNIFSSMSEKVNALASKYSWSQLYPHINRSRARSADFAHSNSTGYSGGEEISPDRKSLGLHN